MKGTYNIYNNQTINTVVTDVPNDGGKLTVVRLLVEMSNVFLFFNFYKIFLF